MNKKFIKFLSMSTKSVRASVFLLQKIWKIIELSFINVVRKKYIQDNCSFILSPSEIILCLKMNIIK
jgi:hypothetical protein